MMIKTPGYGSNCGDSCVISCGIGWERQGNRCYYFSTGERSWFEAEKWCQRYLGTKLASITDEDGYNFINSKKVQRWIGGISEPRNDTWVWTDCSPWDFKRWQSGEPRLEAPDGHDKEKCVVQNAHMSHSSQTNWAVEKCTDKKRFVCGTAVCSGRVA